MTVTAFTFVDLYGRALATASSLLDKGLAHARAAGVKPTLPAERWLTVFATTNLFFHLSTAYGILRAHGVQIGKPDMFASGL